MSLDANIQQWLAWDRDPVTRAEVEKLVSDKATAVLEKLLSQRMEFGTAGLRSTMGAGNSQMNRLTVLQTAQGLAAYMAATNSSELARGVVIGYDGRHLSQEFARITATVMRSWNIKTYLFRQMVPTPFVAFAVRRYGALAGVMVTASHNPKEYNGLKVYWSNGAQIVSPRDAEIASSIAAHLEPRPASWAPFQPSDHIDPYDDIFESFFATLKQSYLPAGAPNTVRFTYTAMHGVGAPFTLHGLKTVLGLHPSHVASVAEQECPDPEFSTVRFPNPEEGKTSLALSFATAARSGSTVILANDPDADRLAVAERTRSGSWRVFNGNEIGALLGWWAVERVKQSGKPRDRCLMLTTAVSSSMLRSIAEAEQVQYSETLTGFKYMGNVALDRAAKEGLLPIFAYEEAIGFMWGDRVFDKDGVTAAVVVADLANYLMAKHQRTLQEQLQTIYKTYGYHFTNNSYVVSDHPSKTKMLLQDIRSFQDGSYPKQVGGHAVQHVVDLGVGIDTREPSGRSPLPKTSMITLFVDGGMKVTIRGSGTEPKLKWYAEKISKNENGGEELKAFVQAVVKELVQPKKYGFTLRLEDADLLSKI